jgi:hypothetical protein
MAKKISLFLAILTLGFAHQIFAQDENASADDSERWSDFLPLNKEMAGDADLPLPFGIGVIGYWQEQDLKPKSINLIATLSDNAFDLKNIGGTDITDLGVTDIENLSFPLPLNATATAAKVESEVDSYSGRIDGWIFPFFNLYGIFGRVDGKNTVSTFSAAFTQNANYGATVLNPTAVNDPGGAAGSPDTWIQADGSIDPTNPTATNVGQVSGAYLGGIEQQFTQFPTINYKGPIYGLGGILAYGKGKYWGTLDYNWVRADLDISRSEIDTITVSPRIGVNLEHDGKKTSLWVGAMYQEVDELQVGSVSVPGLGTIDYEVKLGDENQWNTLIGGAFEVNKQFQVGIEGGFGDRKQVMGNLTYRF